MYQILTIWLSELHIGTADERGIMAVVRKGGKNISIDFVQIGKSSYRGKCSPKMSVRSDIENASLAWM